MKIITQINVLFYIALLVNSPVFAQLHNDNLNQQIDSIFSEFDSQDKPGIAVSIIKDGNVIFTKGYGIANLEYNIPITPSTVFHVASVSKNFTAFALLLLEEQGKLSIDDDVRKFLPELSDFGHKITLRHLATHTSGLRDQQYLLGLAGWRDDDITTDEDVLRLITKQKELNFAPGEKYGYSNTGYTLLAHVISRVSNMSFAEFMNQNIFVPLKMHNTLFKDDYEMIIPNRAYAYHKDGKNYKKSIMNNACVGASNLCTTVEDMSKWSLNYTNPTIGSRSLIEKMSSITMLNNGDTIDVGIGQYPFNYKGLKEIGHEGFDFGFRAYYSRFPDEKFSVIIITNNGRSIYPYELALKVIDLCLENKFTEPYIKDDTYTHKISKNDTNFIYSPEQLKDFSGIFYCEELGVCYDIIAKTNKLEVNQIKIGNINIYPISENIFQDEGIWLYSKFEFIRNNKNEVVEMKFSGGDKVENVKFVKIK
jgi:CubicO group peptidase (beta-lactamase class C family)